MSGLPNDNGGASKAPKSGSEPLSLRVKPPRVARFNRRVVIGFAALGCILVFGASMIALYPPSLNRNQAGAELLTTNRKQVADGLATLPRSYSDVPAKSLPTLGPPLPGDLGPAVTHAEQNLGLKPRSGENFGLRPDPEEDAARAERLRKARQAHEALESKVFFPVSARPGQGGPGRDGIGAASTPAAARPSEIADAASPPRLTLDPERDPNNQQRKLAFLNAKQDDRAIYNPHGLQQPVSPDEVMAGSVIAASLVTGINSDLPGLVTAQVTENVYDTVTGEVLLIPQGARLIGSYDSVVAYGQSRALVVWQRLIMPNGSSVVIDNLPASDAAGYAGLEDAVDYHTWQLLKGIALSTLLGVDSQLVFGNSQSNLIQAIRQSATESTNQAGQRIVEKDLNVQPTITVRPGWPLRVIVHKDLVLQPYRG